MPQHPPDAVPLPRPSLRPHDMRPHRPGRLIFIVVVALVHLALTISLLLLTYSQGMSHFDDGSRPSAGERALNATLHVLCFPLLSLGPSVGGMAGWLLAFANSLCWSGGMSFVLGRCRRRRSLKLPPTARRIDTLCRNDRSPS
jgi:hypothetical protein